MDGPDGAEPGLLDRLQRRKLSESVAEGEREQRPARWGIAPQRGVWALRPQESAER
jgi:hypothetical protein